MNRIFMASVLILSCLSAQANMLKFQPEDALKVVLDDKSTMKKARGLTTANYFIGADVEALEKLNSFVVVLKYSKLDFV